MNRLPVALLIAAALGGTAAMHPDIASAQLPACDAGRAPELSLAAPARLAYGRSATADAGDNSDSESFWYADDSTVRASFRSSDPSRPLTFGFTDAFPADTYFKDWPVRFADGDVSGAVSMTYREYESAPYPASNGECMRTLERSVEAIRGRAPSVSLDRALGRVEFEVYRPSACHRAAMGEVSITVSHGRTRRTVALNDQCGHFTSRGGAAYRKWELRASARYGFRTAQFRDLRRRTGQWDYRYRITALGRTMKTGRFRVITRYRRAYRIWEGTDAFVNVCINDLRRIWSSGGRLYCDEPGFAARRIRLLKRKGA
jgi:hypothetical protein